MLTGGMISVFSYFLSCFLLLLSLNNMQFLLLHIRFVNASYYVSIFFVNPQVSLAEKIYFIVDF